MHDNSDDSPNIQLCLEHVRNRLRDVVDVQYGLLVQMDQYGVLTHEEYTKLRDTTGTYKRIDTLIGMLMNKSDAECTKFLSALNDTSQKHISNYIRYRGGKAL